MNAYATYSDHYRGYVLVDGNGAQLSDRSGRPLVYPTRAAAYVAVGRVWSGNIETMGR